MVARNSSLEWLPPEWTVQCKILPSGRKLKYYTDLKTGKKFYSKNEVLRYTETGLGESFKRRASNRKSLNRTAKKYDTEKPNWTVSHPDPSKMVSRNSMPWLPPRWNVQCKVLSSGRKLKYYTDLKTGKKFYSKNEVLRFTGTKVSKGFKSGASNRKFINHTAKKYLHETEKEKIHPQWLPKGWEIEIRQYEAGPNVGKRYKIYIDPSKSYKFYCKPQVLEYLMENKMQAGFTKSSKMYQMKDDLKPKLSQHVENVKPITQSPNKKRRRTSKAEWSLCPEAVPNVEVLDAEVRGTYVTRSLSLCNAPVYGVQTRGSKRKRENNVENECISTTVDGMAMNSGSKIRNKIDFMHLGKDHLQQSRFSRRLAGVKHEKTERDTILVKEIEDHTRKNSHSSVCNVENDREKQFPRRFSYRLAGLGPELATSSEFSKDAFGVTERKSAQMAEKTEGVSIVEKNELDDNGKNSNTSLRITEKNREGIAQRFSKRLAGFGTYTEFGETTLPAVRGKCARDGKKTASALALDSAECRVFQQHSASISSSCHLALESIIRGCSENKPNLEDGSNCYEGHSLRGNAVMFKSGTRNKVQWLGSRCQYSKRLVGDAPEVLLDNGKMGPPINGCAASSKCSGSSASIFVNAGFDCEAPQILEVPHDGLKGKTSGLIGSNRFKLPLQGLAVRKEKSNEESDMHYGKKCKKSYPSGLSVEQMNCTKSVLAGPCAVSTSSNSISVETKLPQVTVEFGYPTSRNCVKPSKFVNQGGTACSKPDTASEAGHVEGCIDNGTSQNLKTEIPDFYPKRAGVPHNTVTDITVNSLNSAGASAVEAKLSLTAINQVTSVTQEPQKGAFKDQDTQHQAPIWESWSDPCLEFAFKTLTGEISIEDDLQIRSYFQQIESPVQKDASANGDLNSLDFSSVKTSPLHEKLQQSPPIETPPPAEPSWISAIRCNRIDKKNPGQS